jgi:hypothetical protein
LAAVRRKRTTTSRGEMLREERTGRGTSGFDKKPGHTRMALNHSCKLPRMVAFDMAGEWKQKIIMAYITTV